MARRCWPGLGGWVWGLALGGWLRVVVMMGVSWWLLGRPVAGLAGADEAGFVGEYDCLGPVGQAEFGQDMRDVGFDGGFCDEQCAGDGGVGLAAADEAQDL